MNNPQKKDYSLPKVKEWVTKTGLPLEMKTATLFREAGFFVEQSGVYLDPEMNKGREIDVIASYSSSPKIAFVIKCKAMEKPWTIFKLERVGDIYDPIQTFGITSEKAYDLLRKRSVGVDIMRDDFLNHVYNEIPISSGYAFKQAITESKDATTDYAASISVLKAARAYSRRYSSSHLIKSFSFPVIVVSSPLYECSLLNDGSVDLKQVDHGSFLFATYIPELVASTIKVVTEKYLQTYVQDCQLLCEKIKRFVE